MLSIIKFYTDVAQIVFFFRRNQRVEKWKLWERNCIYFEQLLSYCILYRLVLQSWSNYCFADCAKQSTILTAYIISPSHGKGLSSSNSSVLNLRASSMMHCGLGFKYQNFSRLVVSSTEFGQVTVKVRPSHLPWWRLILYPTFYKLLPWRSRISSHNLAFRVRAIVCSDNDIQLAT